MTRFLIVDDSSIVRAVIKKTLAVTGVGFDEICEAADGKQALELMKEKPMSIVFADINMRVMNGVEMIRKMKEDAALIKIPIFVISTEGSQALLDELRSMGVAGFIRKPFAPEDLKKLITAVLGEAK